MADADVDLSSSRRCDHGRDDGGRSDEHPVQQRSSLHCETQFRDSDGNAGDRLRFRGAAKAPLRQPIAVLCCGRPGEPFAP